MTNHKTGTREEWLAARLELLKAEKELTRRSDELARWRQELPWVRIDKEYRFETDKGTASLADLFGGRSQLLIYHFMFGPDYTAGCPAYSAIADGFDASGSPRESRRHALRGVAGSARETAGVQAADGVELPLGVVVRRHFNYDFQVARTDEQQQSGVVEYNFRTNDVRPWLEAGKEGPLAEIAVGLGTDWTTYTREAPGMSAFALRTASYTTPIPPTHAGSTGSGACTSGSTGRHVDATRRTRRGSGSAATTSTTA